MSTCDSLPDQSKHPQKSAEDFLNGSIGLFSAEEALSDGIILVDVRTAEEFAKGSIPEALSRPLSVSYTHLTLPTICSV